MLLRANQSCMHHALVCVSSIHHTSARGGDRANGCDYSSGSASGYPIRVCRAALAEWVLFTPRVLVPSSTKSTGSKSSAEAVAHQLLEDSVQQHHGTITMLTR